MTPYRHSIMGTPPTRAVCDYAWEFLATVHTYSVRLNSIRCDVMSHAQNLRVSRVDGVCVLRCGAIAGITAMMPGVVLQCSSSPQRGFVAKKLL